MKHNKYFTGKPCVRGHVAERYASTRVCVQCQSEYRKNNLENCKANEAKWRVANRETANARSKEWREKYPERQRQSEVNYRKNNAEKRVASCKAYRLANADREQAARRRWAAANKPKLAEKAAKRRGIHKRACVIWADSLKIQEMYDLCGWLTATSGEQWHVDHIVPLISKKVCGLHCEANLMLLPASENLSKGNRWWPDMWD